MDAATLPTSSTHRTGAPAAGGSYAERRITGPWKENNANGLFEIEYVDGRRGTGRYKDDKLVEAIGPGAGISSSATSLRADPPHRHHSKKGSAHQPRHGAFKI